MKRKISRQLSVVGLLIAYPALNVFASSPSEIYRPQSKSTDMPIATNISYESYAMLSNQASGIVKPSKLPHAYTGGFIAGVGIGVELQNYSISNDVSAIVSTYAGDSTIFQNSALGNFFVGYGKVFKSKFYLGSEAGINIVGSSESSATGSFQNSITDLDPDSGITKVVGSSLLTSTSVSQNTLVPSLDIKPGLFITPWTLAFLRLGVSYNQLNVKTSSSLAMSGTYNTNPPVTSLAQFSTSHSDSMIGLRMGLGFEQLITENLGLGFNYVYTYYNPVKTQGSGAGDQVVCDTVEGQCSVVPGASTSASTKSNLSNQDVLLELIYHLS